MAFVKLQHKISFSIIIILLIFLPLVFYYYFVKIKTIYTEKYEQQVIGIVRTVALGVEIALTEKNFQGVQTAIGYAKSEPQLAFVAVLQTDTTWSANHQSYVLTKSVFSIFPENYKLNPNNPMPGDSLIVKQAGFTSSLLQGDVMLGFTTKEIQLTIHNLRKVSLFAGIIASLFILLLGNWFARKLTRPIEELNRAIKKVGEGNLEQTLHSQSNDEVAQLATSFNTMVRQIKHDREELSEKNLIMENQKNILEKEKQRSEALLLNILPKEVAEELMETGKAEARRFNEVTVVFTDFVSFTTITEKMSAEDLVAELDYCFSSFDKIIARYGLEKIKTIGDSYMCVAGLPKLSEENAVDAVSAAIALFKFMEKYGEERKAKGKDSFQMRMGIHSGPVIAGIVGMNKFAYDIWGDTVNVASRMESSGEPGKINISSNTYELVKEYFSCTSRGKIYAKNKGEIEMYFVEGKV